MKHINQHLCRAAALILSMTLAGSCLLPASAAEVAAEKQEVVYANLAGDGSVTNAYVVNIFNPDQAGTITDYGNYASVRNMTSTAPVEIEGDTVTIQAEQGRLYYEGVLEQVQLPWLISLDYALNGAPCTAEELAGGSGALEMHLSIRQNPDCNPEFFDNFALQITFTLDTSKAANIQAEGATAAIVGENRQFTYTVLAGSEKDITITADVTDFEMDAVSINGLPLSIDVEVDDEELMDQVRELLDAIEELDDGAGELQDGAGELDDGAQELKDGVQELQEAAEGDLRDGVDALNDGAGELRDGADALVDGGSALKSGAGELQEGADALDSGLRALNAGVLQVQQGLEMLNSQSGELTGGSARFKEALAQLQQALSGVSDSGEQVQQLVDASDQIKQGIDLLTTGAQELRDNVNYAGYKAVMLENGLDIDALKAGNTEAIRSIEELLGKVSSLENKLQAMGVPTSFLEPIKQQGIDLANQMLLLLKGNNASIEGTEAYLDAVNEQLTTLAAGAEELQNNYAEFDAAIGQLADSLTDLMGRMVQLTAAVNSLVEAYEDLDSGLSAYTDGVAQVLAGYEQVSGGTAELVKGSGALKSGADGLYDGTAQLLRGLVELYDATGTLRDGTGELDEGVETLLTGIAELYDGTVELKDGTSELKDGTGELKDGTGEMRAETDGMDDDIQEQIDDLLASISGNLEEIPSFVSDKNTRVETVQFVLSTPAIRIVDDSDGKEEEQPEPTFWEKLMGLFF
ncbi:MAG: hypothetical protein ACI3VN_03700 [Candidatus Onthomonas sp.]